ncbi:hypothetical protein BDN67DRAFT_872040, partial [Paxillus ammoniavirescens]
LTLSSDPTGTSASLVKDWHVLFENPMRENRSKKESSVKEARKQGSGNRKKLETLGRNAAEAEGLRKLE